MRPVRSSEALMVIAPTLVLARSASAQGGGADTDWTYLLGVIGIVGTLFLLGAMGLLRWWRARQPSYDDPTPPLITMPHSPSVRPVTPARGRRTEPSVETHNTAPVTIPSPALHSPAKAYDRPGNGSGTDGELVDGNTVRFYRPPDGTLQLLPGRLEIVAGEDIPHDIRFIRARGEEPEVTFGRSDGPPHRHIQLHARTVSRQHARMRFAEKRWLIENLSETNPVVINGRELDSVDGGYVLREGDRIEMGEVVFLFRER